MRPRSNRAAVRARLDALEERAAARHGGPVIGWQDPLSLAVFGDGGQVYNNAAEFYEASRRGNKTGILICRDCEASPHNTAKEAGA